jgi:hypothetical protein
MLFCPVFFFPKAAIFLLYRQLFAVGKRFRMAIDAGLLVTFLLYLSEIPLAVIYAAPRPGHSWDSLLVTLEANEHPFALGGTIQSVFGTVLDLYIFFLPLPTLYRLQMPSRRRWQLIGIFSTALLYVSRLSIQFNHLLRKLAKLTLGLSSGVGASVVSLVCKIKILSSKDSNWLAAITSMTSYVLSHLLAPA